MDDLFKSLDIDKSEWLEDIKHGDSSSASFMASVEECISERESRKFEEGLNTKVKLGMYKRFGKSVEFKKYLHGICDAGSRLLFKFRSGTHGLNEELGRHRGREGKTECSLCGNECENVSHVLWECSAYSSIRASFMKKLQELLEDDYEDFESLETVEKSSYVLGSELWESKFDGLLALVNEYIVDVWEIRKHKLYDTNCGCVVCNCGSVRCKTCSCISQGSTFVSNVTKRSYDVVSPNLSMDCTSENVVYLITCKKCGIQYVGETSQ